MTDSQNRYARKVRAEGGEGTTVTRSASAKSEACGASVTIPDLDAELSLTVTPFGTWDLVTTQVVMGENGREVRRTTVASGSFVPES